MSYSMRWHSIPALQNCVAQIRTVAHTQRYLIVSISTQCSYRNFDPRLEKQDPRHYSCYVMPVMTPRCLSFLCGFILLGTSVSPLPVYHVRTGRVSPGGYFTLPMRRIFATELIFEIHVIFLETALLRIIDFRRFSGRDWEGINCKTNQSWSNCPWLGSTAVQGLTKQANAVPDIIHTSWSTVFPRIIPSPRKIATRLRENKIIAPLAIIRGNMRTRSEPHGKKTRMSKDGERNTDTLHSIPLLKAKQKAKQKCCEVKRKKTRSRKSALQKEEGD